MYTYQNLKKAGARINTSASSVEFDSFVPTIEKNAKINFVYVKLILYYMQLFYKQGF